MGSFDVVLDRARMLTPSVRELVFRRVDGAPMAFAPGQWVNLFFTGEDGNELKRSYSIASAPDGSPSFALAVTRVSGGPASSRLHALAPGDELRAVGPSGLFTRDPSNDRGSLLVATGTGIAPLRSMLHAARAAASPAPMTLLLGVRHEEDLLYRDELEAMRDVSFRFEPTLSQPAETWSGKRGYVQGHLDAALVELRARGASDPEVYICGLERMVKAVKDHCRGPLGLDRKRVHQERYD